MALFHSFRTIVLGTALSFMGSTVLASAQDISDTGGLSSREAITLQNQIAALRQQLSQVQSNSLPAPSNSSDSASSPRVDNNLVTQLLERVSALEEQNRKMRGELDQLSNTVDTTKANLSKKISDMEFASQNGGGGGVSDNEVSTPSLTSKTSAAVSSTAPVQPKTALEALKLGNIALRSGRYADAENNARFAVRTAKTTAGKMDAQFLLAQSLAGQRQYKQSALAYYDAYGKSPQSPKAQDSLLGVAASLIALGDKNSACQALDKLKTEFPNAASRVKSAEKTFRGRASCH